jgi:hypothetical protein
LNRSLAIVVTLALLAGAVYVGRNGNVQRTPSVDAQFDSPEQCLERLFSAAEKGDVASWLDCFTGAQRKSLIKEVESKPAEEFAASLQEAVCTVKGRAISGPRRSSDDTASATLSVERVYAHHIERQSYHFRREPDGWRIESLGAVEKRQPAIPYGTPVFDLVESPQAETSE